MSGIESARNWVVSIAQRAGYQHSLALLEAAESMVFALRSLGLQATMGPPSQAADALLLFGAHLLSPGVALPAGTVIFNLEQLTDWSKQPEAKPYFDLMARFPVWDYSQANVDVLRAAGHQRVSHVPLGYVPELARVRAVPKQDIDVLFYGSRNERRNHVLAQLQARGLKVQALFGVYGEQRDQYIGRAKVVLNTHFYESGTFETARVSYLLTNRKAVVCEHSMMNPDDEALRDGMAYVPYDGLVQACEDLVKDEAERKRLELRGFELFSARPQTAILAELLGLPKPTREALGAIPLTLHLGSGKDFREDGFNVDIDPFWQPDAVLDLGRPLPFGEPLQTERFGPVRLLENTFEKLVANDVLEHIPDLVCAMTNALRLLRPGGEFEISVPYELGLGAWQDPTHVRAFNENSWLYYTDWFWYLGWTEQRFDVVHTGMQLSPLGMGMKNQGVDLQTIMRTPRAVDSMQVRLRKRYLSSTERREVAERRSRTQRAPVAPGGSQRAPA